MTETQWFEFCAQCTFMRPYIERGEFFRVETTHGTEIIPADVIGRTVGTAAEAFANYCEGSIVDPDECVAIESGYLARLSAPGYMDCTEWSAHESEDAAREYLIQTYGE
jgi:hypothetical protein